MAKEKKIKTEPLIDIRQRTSIKWKDIKHLQFEDDDEFSIGWNEPYYSENNSWDGYYSAIITRKRLETDEEFQKRIEKEEIEIKRMKDDRFKTYLRLKKEFEG